jgi:dTDP-4-dehydrorhamnose 3,5-epimerase
LNRFTVIDTPLLGLKIIQRKRIGDDRGFLQRLFCASELKSIGWQKPVAQINHTFTQKKGTVRGIHFQRQPHVEAKLVSCIKGEIWDVAVDLRTGSPGFLQWHAEHLSEENQRALLIPEGFAHGFQSLSDECELIYVHSAAYAADAEGGLNARDPRLDISWPLPITGLSDRDEAHPLIDDSFTGVST